MKRGILYTNLEKEPVAGLSRLLEHQLSSRSLSLAQRYRVQFPCHSQFLGKLVQLRGGIRSTREHENKGSRRAGFLVYCIQSRCLGFNEATSEKFRNIKLHRVRNFVGSQTLQYEHLLEIVQITVPWLWIGFSKTLERFHLAIIFSLIIESTLWRQGVRQN